MPVLGETWEPSQVTRDELSRFLDEKGREAKCSFCGVFDWAIVIGATEDAKNPESLPYASDFEDMRSYSIACGNCGHVVRFAAEVVYSWALENPTR